MLCESHNQPFMFGLWSCGVGNHQDQHGRRKLSDSHPAISRVIFTTFRIQQIGIPNDRHSYFGWTIAFYGITRGVTSFILLLNKRSNRQKDEGDANVETNAGGFEDDVTYDQRQ